MVFHDVVREDRYDLWVGDEAWELDYYLHENPREKRARYAWLTDFVGWLPMPDGGEHEAYLTADYAAIYPAVQNMCLAARALGLGTTLTTRHTGFGKECDAIFGLPPGVQSYAILPIGYPMGKFGPVGRGPLKDFVYGDQWGQPYAGL